MSNLFRSASIAAVLPLSLLGSAAAQVPQRDDRVEFRVRETRATDSMRVFEAEYPVDRPIARFAISFRSFAQESSDMPVVKAALMARPGSDARGLLQALARLHGGQARSTSGRRLAQIDVTAAVLGQGLSHGPGTNVIAGEFTDQPKGDWLVLKLFLDTADGATTEKIGEPAELFVALNGVTGEGWFLVKDPEYWPELNRVLALVL
jgi:hypothetical protein